jgi:hypothetical protein
MPLQTEIYQPILEFEIPESEPPTPFFKLVKNQEIS